MAERRIEYQMLNARGAGGFMVSAPSLQRLYIDVGLSLTDIMVKLDRVQETDRKTVAATGDNKVALMMAWLSQILELFNGQDFVARRIVFDLFDGKRIKATLWGEKYQPVRHGHVTKYAKVTEEKFEFGDREKPEPHFFVKVFLEH